MGAARGRRTRQVAAARGLRGPPAALPAAARSILNRLLARVDIASLVYFRILFGAIMLWEVVKYYRYGWISRFFIEPPFLFKYYGFEWVQAWPGVGLYIHFAAMGVLALFIVVGLWYRVSAILFFLAYAYFFLLDQAVYLNHLYLIGLISFLMIFIPAHRAFSVDAARHPSLRSDTAPAWALWMLRGQISIVYVFGGIAKLNGDWLHAQPLGIWLAKRSSYPLVGPFFAEEWAAYLFSYGGLLFDLFIVPLLLWRRTRPFALAGAIGFHLANNTLFSIGIFPWLMIAGTMLFLSPDWPRRLLQRLRLLRPTKTGARSKPAAPTGLRRGQWAIASILGLYFLAQLLMPLRHHLYPGNVQWTTEGHRFSWMMKLNDKQPSNLRFSVMGLSKSAEEKVITPPSPRRWQERRMATRPDLILQFAHYVADELRKQGFEDFEVHAETSVSLNGRASQPLIDSSVDLARQRRSLMPASWILPLEEPLPKKTSRTP